MTQRAAILHRRRAQPEYAKAWSARLSRRGVGVLIENNTDLVIA